MTRVVAVDAWAEKWLFMVVFTNKLVLLPSIPGDKVRHSWQSLSTIRDVFWWTRLVAGDAWAEKLFFHIIGGAISRVSCDVR